MTHVCVFGAGAVGSLLASHLMRLESAEVSIVARGPHLEAIAEHGLRLLSNDREWIGRPRAATDRPQTLPPQDIVFVTLKTVSQSACAKQIASLLAPWGHAVFVNNGIPWWWKHGLTDAGPLPLIDRDGELWRSIGPSRVLGCVVYSANELIAPGVVRHSGNNRWLLGEPRGGLSPRLEASVGLLQRAGLSAEASPDLRLELWSKLLRNVASNSLCALTRLPIDGIPGDEELMRIADKAIDEVTRIACAHGADVQAQAGLTKQSIRSGGGIEGVPLRGVRPSMLQDVLAERPIEVEAIIGQVQSLARERSVPCPTLDLLLPLVRGLARSIAARA